jgi:four helix bundle protein
MMGVESYQHRTFRFALAILGFYRKLTANPGVPRHVASQLCRAGTSIGANIEEAKSAYSRREMAVKYSIALREGRECLYWLRLIGADQPVLAPATKPLIDEVDQLIAILTTTVRKLRSTERPSNKAGAQ